MGYTMRTDQYRYTEWVSFHQGPEFKPNFADIFHNEGTDFIVFDTELINAMYVKGRSNELTKV